VVQAAPCPLGLPPKSLIVTSLVGLGLAGELAVVRESLGAELSRLDRPSHGTARLGLVTTVAEAALGRVGGNVREHGLEAVLARELELPHTRVSSSTPPPGSRTSCRWVVT